MMLEEGAMTDTTTREAIVPADRPPAHYPGAVYDTPEMRRARKAVRDLAAARKKVDEQLEVLRTTCREVFEAYPDLGPVALAREIGVSEGTLRGYTADLARARRRQKEDG